MVELDTFRDIVEIAPDHAVVSDYLVTVGQESVGEMTAQKSGDAGYENSLFRQD